MNEYDAVIVGGGIMGCLGAYQIAKNGGRVAVVERAAIGNAQAGSAGITRSLRSDYQDEQYAALAREAWDLWLALQQEWGVPVLQTTGCLNVATGAAPQPYAQSAAAWLARDQRRHQIFKGELALRARFPQLRGFTFGVLEPAAGLGFPRRALQILKEKLQAAPGCQLYEHTAVEKIVARDGRVEILTKTQNLRAKKLIIAAGLGSPQLLQQIESCRYQLPLAAARPTECLYYIPREPAAYQAEALPAFACLDDGIYAHPIVAGLTPGLKIGRYHPPAAIHQSYEQGAASIRAFMRQHMPQLAASARITAVTNTDQCAYDMTPDGGFALGPVPGQPAIFLAAGFCGTGYKFAPVVAEAIADFAGDARSRHNISVFDPARFSV